MANYKRLLDALIVINNLSNDNRLEFKEKLNRIIFEIIGFMQAKSGSIMLFNGRKNLEVIASTNANFIGTRQPLYEESPSTWVVKYKAPLYVDDISGSRIFSKRFDHYEGCAFYLAPIMSYEKVIGVISVTDKISEDLFSKEEQKALLYLAGQVISALENQRLTESLIKKRQDLQKKNRRLRKLETIKTDLFNMLIHDLKGPISEVIANLDILSYTVSEKNRESVELAQGGCDTLYGMVSNLLDIARLEEGKLKLIYEKIDPRDLIKEALARLFGMVKTKGITFVEKFPTRDTMNSFWGDRGLILRILQNLLTNAISYSPRDETVEVGFEYLKSPKIRFFVKDNGPGVSPEHRDNIFNKYCQLKKKHDGRLYTTGLGLTFCKMAVDAHRGKIGVENDTRGGCRFFFVLPLDNKK